jgi:ankyrin repeat protein
MSDFGDPGVMESVPDPLRLPPDGTPEGKLGRAILAGNLDAVKKLLTPDPKTGKRAVDIKYNFEDEGGKNDFGPSPLTVFAARHAPAAKVKPMLEYLLSEKMEPNIAGWSGYTALHWVAKRDIPDAAGYLMGRKSDFLIAATDPNIKAGSNYNYVTPLMLAAQCPNSKCLQTMLQHPKPAQVDVMANTSYPSALGVAVMNNRTENVEVLLKHGSDVKPDGNAGVDLSIEAVKNGNIEMLKRLKAAGLSIKDARGGPDKNTALHEVRHKHMLDYLLDEEKLDINALNREGHPAVNYLASIRREPLKAGEAPPVELAEELVRRGADIHIRGTGIFNEYALLGSAISGGNNELALRLLRGENTQLSKEKLENLQKAAIYNGNIEIIKELEKKWQEQKLQPSWDKVLKQEGSILMPWARTKGAVDYLISKDIPVDASASDTTLLGMLVQTYPAQQDLIKHLVSKGASISAGRRTPLQLAVDHKELTELMPLLSPNGNGNFSGRDRDGDTVLHKLVKEMDAEKLDILLRHGRLHTSQVRDKDGRTALGLANEMIKEREEAIKNGLTLEGAFAVPADIDAHKEALKTLRKVQDVLLQYEPRSLAVPPAARDDVRKLASTLQVQLADTGASSNANPLALPHRTVKPGERDPKSIA